MPIEIRELTIKAVTTTIQQLEQRIANLERALQLSGGKVTLQSGGSSIELTPVGVEIAARDVTINCSGKLSMKASGDVVIKGRKILQN